MPSLSSMHRAPPPPPPPLSSMNRARPSSPLYKPSSMPGALPAPPPPPAPPAPYISSGAPPAPPPPPSGAPPAPAPPPPPPPPPGSSSGTPKTKTRPDNSLSDISESSKNAIFEEIKKKHTLKHVSPKERPKTSNEELLEQIRQRKKGTQGKTSQEEEEFKKEQEEFKKKQEEFKKKQEKDQLELYDNMMQSKKIKSYSGYGSDLIINNNIEINKNNILFSKSILAYILYDITTLANRQKLNDLIKLINDNIKYLGDDIMIKDSFRYICSLILLNSMYQYYKIPKKLYDIKEINIEKKSYKEKIQKIFSNEKYNAFKKFFSEKGKIIKLITILSLDDIPVMNEDFINKIQTKLVEGEDFNYVFNLDDAKKIYDEINKLPNFKSQFDMYSNIYETKNVSYKNKYLKYKQKYLKLKATL